LHRQPLGVVEFELPPEGLSAEGYARRIWAGLGAAIRAHLAEDELPTLVTLDASGLPPLGTPTCLMARGRLLAQPPRATVVLATRDRPASVAICLESLLAMDYPEFEIVVVDNAPSSSATADLVRAAYGATPRVRYVCEPQPGLSSARNRGLELATGAIVAFTDDDVVVDPDWLSALVAGFQFADRVACVTGLIFPRALDTPAQVLVEQYWGLGKGYTRRVFDMREHRLASPLYPYASGTFGSGGNLAFQTGVLRDLGGFDPALGAGTPARGGEDLAIFFHTLAAGHQLVYEPAAVVHHLHRRDYAGVRRQTYGYGVGLTAYLTKCLIDEPWRCFDLARRAPHGLRTALSSRSAKNARKPSGYPSDLTRLELLGMLYGPLAYVLSRAEARSKHTGQPGSRRTADELVWARR
jgi:glycosyltransferase involved in cell wall biosynthesis